MLTCKIAETEKEIIDNLLIRNEVFCIEQNISKEEEFDGLDELSTLFVLYLESNPIGAARLRILDDFTWKIERLSILKEYRNKSYGSFLLNYLENYIKSLNFYDITLNAQESAEIFYLKHNYNTIGDYFLEANIKHIKMNKNLNK